MFPHLDGHRDFGHMDNGAGSDRSAIDNSQGTRFAGLEQREVVVAYEVFIYKGVYQGQGVGLDHWVRFTG